MKKRIFFFLGMIVIAMGLLCAFAIYGEYLVSEIKLLYEQDTTRLREEYDYYYSLWMENSIDHYYIEINDFKSVLCLENNLEIVNNEIITGRKNPDGTYMCPNNNFYMMEQLYKRVQELLLKQDEVFSVKYDEKDGHIISLSGYSKECIKKTGKYDWCNYSIEITEFVILEE